MKFKTAYNSKEFESKGEVYTLPSMTVPDQTLTIREMLERHSRGLAFSGVKVPIYEETDIFNGVNPKKLDLSELQDLRDQVLDRIKEEQSAAKMKKKQELEAKRQQDIEDAVKSRIEAQNTKKTGEEPV